MGNARRLLSYVSSAVRKTARSAVCHAPRPIRDRLFRGYYPYMFTPDQLLHLCHCIERTRNVPGAVLEIGCASGKTTTFLNRYMDAVGIDKPYVVIDTFRGFVPEDVDLEVRRRGKPKSVSRFFRATSKKRFECMVESNELHRVTAIEADISEYDFEDVDSISFCLLDVDLYRPTRSALPGVFRRLSPGGVVIVDDCVDDSLWDGAYQAFAEFTADHGLETRIRCGKLGEIQKPAAEARQARV